MTQTNSSAQFSATRSRISCFAIAAILIVTATVLSVTDANARGAKHSRRGTSKRIAVASTEKLTIIVDGRVRKSVAMTSINTIRYCAINSLQLSASPQKGQQSTDLVISNNRISAQQSSFFVMAEDEQQSRVAQMTVPCIHRQNTLLVPFPHFFDALATLGLCTIDEKEKSVHWMQNQHRVGTQPPSLPSLRKAGSMAPISPGPQRNLDQDDAPQLKEPVQDQKSGSPLRYQLPRDLKRRELDDTTMKWEQGSVLRPAKREFSEPLFASLLYDVKRNPARITRIKSSVEGGSSTISFTFDKAVDGVEQPTFDKAVVRLEFPNAINTVRNLREIKKLNVINAESFLADGSQVFRITLRSTERSVRLERQSATQYVLHIDPAKPVLAKNTRAKWDLDVIVIDAGHGGKDAGAESVHKKYEKDITLAIALKLRSELKKRVPKARIVLTRSTDVFVELDKRGEIANRADGKLFISIHCNSTPQKPSPATGFETYILSPAKTETAIDVAKRENSVIQLEEKSDRYKSLTDDQLIVATLAQNSFVKFSTAFAALVQKNLGRQTSMIERSVNQAGFIVLIGASMPAVLVETGFVSNTKDEKILTSVAGQLSIAQGIAEAVHEYSNVYSRILRD